MDFVLEPRQFEDLEGWKDEDPSSLFPMMARCLAQIRDIKPYKTGAVGVTAAELATVFAAASDVVPGDAREARQFFEKHFQPFLVSPPDQKPGLVTAFYEPEVEVSATRSDEWYWPFYRRPDDLVDLDDANRPASLDPSYAFARERAGAIDPYPDRQAIDQGYLEGQALEIAWARSRVDVFFAHVQGAARLRYPDGSLRRITYAAKAGHPFTGIGRHLITIGEIAEADVSMQSIRAWLAAHPERESEILWQNRSYIFFREAPVDDLGLGPVAAAKVPLAAMRSVAIDRRLHTFSSLFFIRSPSLTHLTEGRPFERLMMGLDTGTAIVGPARGDIFTGSGFQAGELAGNVRNDAEFYVLIPLAAAERYR